MEPVFYLGLFALFPLFLAAKEDWESGLVTNVYSFLIGFGALASFVLISTVMWSYFNLAGILVWFVALGLAWYSAKKSKVKLLGLADIYLGLALTMLLGVWANFLFGMMSAALVVYLLVS